MNFRRILLAVLLASLLATVGVPARSAAVVLAPTTVDVYTLEFEPTQKALAGSYDVDLDERTVATFLREDHSVFRKRLHLAF